MNLPPVPIAAVLCALLVWGNPAGAAESKEHERRLQQANSYLQRHNYKSAYNHFHSLAKGGCPTSQCIVGIMHQHGIGVPKDASQAVYWFDKSASQGFADAQLRLGKLYLSGESVARDTEKATYWLSKAADKDVAEAQYELGRFYSESGAPQMIANGQKLLRRAARNGYKDAQTLVSKLPQVPDASPAAANPVSGGLQNISHSWEGYADVAKQLTAIDQQAAKPQ